QPRRVGGDGPPLVLMTRFRRRPPPPRAAIDRPGDRRPPSPVDPRPPVDRDRPPRERDDPRRALSAPLLEGIPAPFDVLYGVNAVREAMLAGRRKLRK